VRTPPAELAERLWNVADRALQQGSDLRIDDLADLTGIPRATLYYYFSGKEDVLVFLLTQQLDRGTETIATAARSEGGATLKLEAVLRAMLRTMAEHPALCTRLMGFVANGPAGAQLMGDVERTMMAPVRDLLTEAGAAEELVVTDPTDTTLALIGAVSTIAMVRTAAGSYDPDDVADRLIPLLLNGLVPRSSKDEPSSS
jgi:AcrR family transcriptional regulator